MQITPLAVGGLDDNFAYVLHDPDRNEVAIVDPCGDVSLIRKTLGEIRDAHPKYILLTHGHHDHTEGVAAVKRFFTAPVVAHPACAYPHELSPRHAQKLPFGKLAIECLHSPGHSADSLLYHLTDDSALFTGDTLFIDCCGYCAAEPMFKTMREIIWPLADANIVYSGHDYGRVPAAPLGEEKRLNPYLYTTAFAQFKELLKKL